MRFQEVQGLAQLSGTLKVAASRFQNSIKALGQLKNSSEGHTYPAFCLLNLLLTRCQVLKSSSR